MTAPRNFIPASDLPFLNVNHVWDFATNRWAQVVEIELDDYRLDNSIPTTPEYPSRWRLRNEIGNSWRDPHGFIFASTTEISR